MKEGGGKNFRSDPDRHKTSEAKSEPSLARSIPFCDFTSVLAMLIYLPSKDRTDESTRDLHKQAAGLLSLFENFGRCAFERICGTHIKMQPPPVAHRSRVLETARRVAALRACAKRMSHATRCKRTLFPSERSPRKRGTGGNRFAGEIDFSFLETAIPSLSRYNARHRAYLEIRLIDPFYCPS